MKLPCTWETGFLSAKLGLRRREATRLLLTARERAVVGEGTRVRRAHGQQQARPRHPTSACPHAAPRRPDPLAAVLTRGQARKRVVWTARPEEGAIDSAREPSSPLHRGVSADPVTSGDQGVSLEQDKPEAHREAAALLSGRRTRGCRQGEEHRRGSKWPQWEELRLWHGER